MPELPDLVHVEAGLRAGIGGKRIAARADRRSDGAAAHGGRAVPRPAGRASGRGGRPARALHVLRARTATWWSSINAMLVGRFELAGRRAHRQEDPRALGAGAGARRRRWSCATSTRSGWARSTSPAPPTRRRSRCYGKLGSTSCRRAFTLRRRSARRSRKRRDQVRAVPDGQDAPSPRSATPTPTRSCSPPASTPRPSAASWRPRTIDAPLRGDRRGHCPTPSTRSGGATSRSTSRCATSSTVRGRDGKPCPVCGTTIRAVRVGDGDACFCPTCQPETRKLFINWSGVPGRAPSAAPEGKDEKAKPTAFSKRFLAPKR